MGTWTARVSLLCFKHITLGLLHSFSVLFKLFESLPYNLYPLWCSFPQDTLHGEFRLCKLTGQPPVCSKSSLCSVFPTLMSQTPASPTWSCHPHQSSTKDTMRTMSGCLPSFLCQGQWCLGTFPLRLQAVEQIRLSPLSRHLMVTVVCSTWLCLYLFSALT